jgi:hypothetical protein
MSAETLNTMRRDLSDATDDEILAIQTINAWKALNEELRGLIEQCDQCKAERLAATSERKPA